MPIALLPDRTVVSVTGQEPGQETGEEAETFLQGVVTCNVATLPEGEARLGALLSPQGKILFDFLVSRMEGGFRLDVAAARAADFARRLSLYRLRAKVAIAADPTVAVAAAWAGSAPAASVATLRDARLLELGNRLYATQGAFSADATEADYHAHRIRLGIPEGGRDFPFGEAFPHEALMDQVGGVDFRKGCYVGQEVVSRMQHRATARTRIVPVVYLDGEAPEPGTEVSAGQKSLGVAGSGAGSRGLASLRLDRLADALAAGEPLRAGGRSLGVERPAFATFAFPEAATAPAV